MGTILEKGPVIVSENDRYLGEAMFETDTLKVRILISCLQIDIRRQRNKNT